jgi:hypothetical protein
LTTKPRGSSCSNGIAEDRNAYPKVKKAWDFNRVGTKQVLDTTRTMDRKKKGKAE